MMIFFIKGIIYAIYIVPPMMGMAPDDIGHFSYIQYLAIEKKLPVLTEATIEEIPYASFNESKQGIFQDLKLNRYFHPTNSENWIVQHPPLYYLIMMPFYILATYFTDSLANVLIFLRIMTLLIGVLTIFIIYKILHILVSNFYIQSCILFSFVFSPNFQYYFSNITNDSLLIFLCTLSLFFLIYYFKFLKTKYFFFFVITSACVILTKYTGALLLIGYIILFLVWEIKNKGIKKTLYISILGLLIGFILIAPYFYHNFILYNNLFWPKSYNYSNYLYSSQSKNIFSLFRFLIENKYFDKIFQNVCILIGWTNVIGSNYIITLYNAIIIAFFSLLYLKGRSNSFKFILLFLSILLFSISFFYFKFYISTSIVVAASLIIGLSLFTGCKKSRIIDMGLFVSILIVVIGFIYEHYSIYLNIGGLDAINGRYYYILFFPVTYLVFNSLQNITNIKLEKFVSGIYLFCQIGFEGWAINQMILGLL